MIYLLKRNINEILKYFGKKIFLIKGECNNFLVFGLYGVFDSYMIVLLYYEDFIYRDSLERVRLNLEDECV